MKCKFLGIHLSGPVTQCMNLKFKNSRKQLFHPVIFWCGWYYGTLTSFSATPFALTPKPPSLHCCRCSGCCDPFVGRHPQKGWWLMCKSTLLCCCAGCRGGGPTALSRPSSVALHVIPRCDRTLTRRGNDIRSVIRDDGEMTLCTLCAATVTVQMSQRRCQNIVPLTGVWNSPPSVNPQFENIKRCQCKCNFRVINSQNIEECKCN